MHAHVLIKRYADDRHPAGSDVPRDGHEAQRRGGVDVVAVDYVHVAGDEDGDGAEAEDGGGNYGGPDGDCVLFLLVMYW